MCIDILTLKANVHIQEQYKITGISVPYSTHTIFII